jgi:hypothetical protein
MLSSPIQGPPIMKRFLASALIVGVSTFGVVGCDQTSSDVKKEELKTPTGSTTVTTKTEVDKSGDHKDPAPVTPPSTEAPK